MRTQTGPRNLIRPELKHWDCTDHDPIEAWVPDDPDVIYWLTLSIGLSDSPAADYFTVCVATPGGLRSSLGMEQKPRGANQPKAIVLQAYSWEGVMAAVQERLDACVGRDWPEIQEKLRAEFMWEYEGMS